MLATEIEMRLGFTPHALVLGLDSIKKATEANPFPDAEAAPSRLHLGFLGAQLTNPDLEGLAKLRKESERFHLSCDVFYLYAPEGIGRSKLAANAERLLGVPMTMRNWRTVCKMRDLAARRHRSNKTGSHSC
jgi:uncharacterized protein (DUF1697 family)